MSFRPKKHADSCACPTCAARRRTQREIERRRQLTIEDADRRRERGEAPPPADRAAIKRAVSAAAVAAEVRATDAELARQSAARDRAASDWRADRFLTLRREGLSRAAAIEQIESEERGHGE